MCEWAGVRAGGHACVCVSVRACMPVSRPHDSASLRLSSISSNSKSGVGCHVQGLIDRRLANSRLRTRTSLRRWESTAVRTSSTTLHADSVTYPQYASRSISRRVVPAYRMFAGPWLAYAPRLFGLSHHIRCVFRGYEADVLVGASRPMCLSGLQGRHGCL